MFLRGLVLALLYSILLQLTVINMLLFFFF